MHVEPVINPTDELAPNFHGYEMACHCCGEIKADKRLMMALQDLRDLIRRPIRIISGYRCKRHNDAIGGALHSQHLLGKAADIQVEGMSVKTLYAFAKKVGAFARGGIGTYPTFLHVDVRNGPARWGYFSDDDAK